MTANQAPTRTREDQIPLFSPERIAMVFEQFYDGEWRRVPYRVYLELRSWECRQSMETEPALVRLADVERLLIEAEQRGEARARSEEEAAPRSFQDRVNEWMQACFGAEISADRQERNHRFLEEALEIVQAAGCTASEAHQLVDYVYGRPVGELRQEAGGVMVTFAALCLAHGIDGVEAGEVELARVWTKVEKIRAKQAAKPKHSPLPEAEAAQGEPVVWPNGCDKTVIDALEFLASNDRPSGGQATFNYEHLLQIADELKRGFARVASAPNDRAEIERLRAALTRIRDSKPFVDGNAALRRIAEKALASAPTQGGGTKSDDPKSVWADMTLEETAEYEAIRKHDRAYDAARKALDAFKTLSFDQLHSASAAIRARGEAAHD